MLQEIFRSQEFYAIAKDISAIDHRVLVEETRKYIFNKCTNKDMNRLVATMDFVKDPEFDEFLNLIGTARLKYQN